MNTTGKIAFAIILLLFAVGYCEFSTAMILQVPKISSNHWVLAVQGITLNFVYLAACTTIFAVAKLNIFPDSYFSTKPFEREGRIYRLTGIQIFESLLRRVGWERLLRKNMPIKCDIAALQNYSNTTRGAEAIHVASGILTALFALSLALRGSFAVALWISFFNVFVNVYPIMLQRYNRPRVQRLIWRLQRQPTSPG